MSTQMTDDRGVEAETFEGSAIGEPAEVSRIRSGKPRAHLVRGAYLEIEGAERSAPIPLTKATMRVGRGMTADITIDNTTVSRRHALIVRRGQRTLVLDDRSLNGVHVNGRRVTEAPLRDGDIIVLGRVVIRYREVR
jgi:FHA domain